MKFLILFSILFTYSSVLQAQQLPTSPTASTNPQITTNNQDSLGKIGEWSALPISNFRQIVAAVREPQFSLRREFYNSSDERINAAVVSFGDSLPVAGYRFDEQRQLQFSIDGTMYALFNLDTSSYNLINTDYYFGLSLSYSDGPFSSRLRVYHVSSHLGDEFILDNPDFDRENSSYEDTELLLAYEIESWRFYGGGGSIFRSNSLNKLEPLHFRVGSEFRQHAHGQMDFLVALDVEIAQRTDWTIARSLLAGVVLAQTPTKEIRFMLGYFRGNSPQGQFFKERLEYYSMGFYFII